MRERDRRSRRRSVERSEQAERRWTTSPVVTAWTTPESSRTSSSPCTPRPTASPSSTPSRTSDTRTRRPRVTSRSRWARSVATGSSSAVASSVRNASSSDFRSTSWPASRLQAVAVAASSGGNASQFTLTPSPTTRASPSCSARIPASLRSPTTTSLGHFIPASTPATVRTARANATAAAMTARWASCGPPSAGDAEQHRDQQRRPRRGLPGAVEAPAAGRLVVGDDDQTFRGALPGPVERPPVRGVELLEVTHPPAGACGGAVRSVYTSRHGRRIRRPNARDIRTETAEDPCSPRF